MIKLIFKFFIFIASLLIIYMVLLFNNTTFEFFNNRVLIYDRAHINYPLEYKSLEKIMSGNGFVIYKFTSVKKWKKETPVWITCSLKDTEEVPLNLFFNKYIPSQKATINVFSANNVTIIMIKEIKNEVINIYFIHLFSDYGGAPSVIKSYQQICLFKSRGEDGAVATLKTQ